MAKVLASGPFGGLARKPVVIAGAVIGGAALVAILYSAFSGPSLSTYHGRWLCGSLGVPDTYTIRSGSITAPTGTFKILNVKSNSRGDIRIDAGSVLFDIKNREGKVFIEEKPCQFVGS